MLIFYFTSTGNSLAVAKRIGGNLISIPHVVNSNVKEYKDDAIGLIFPIYSLGLPEMVRQFLNNVKLDAGYTFAIGTYGNMPGAALLELQNLAKAKGFCFDYANSLLMVDNYLPMFEINKQIARLPEKKTEEMTVKIVEDIHNHKHLQTTAAWWARGLTALLRVFDNMAYNGKQCEKYIINDQCNKCGICAKVCPAGNIIVNHKMQFKSKCQGCLACVHHCPRNAIHLKNEKSAKRWRNPEVSLKEIIDSNEN
ncbi:MAG: EFR1 family ferrodoxin [Candidatus Wallbacteria bacterium]